MRTNTAESAASPQQHHFCTRIGSPRWHADPHQINNQTTSRLAATPALVHLGYSRKHSKLAASEPTDATKP